jgi:hypothetical protein
MVSTLRDIAYKHESDPNVKERILLVRRFNSDGKKVAMICKEELIDRRPGLTNGCQGSEEKAWKV